jgi:hypothetical protein
MINKQITVIKTENAVLMANSAGLKTDKTVINPIRYAVLLDYPSFTISYPIPLTVISKKMKNMSIRD